MPAEHPARPANDPAGFHYPPVDPGIPALPCKTLLDAHKRLIDRIKLGFGMDRAAFDAEIMPLLERYTGFVHLLPCTPDNYFDAPGGMLRIGLETAFHALQGTDAHIFSGRATISERTHLEPRWRRATFIAGLCAELHRVFTHMIVTDQTGNEWSPYLGPLGGWLTGQGVERYFLKWRPGVRETRALGLFGVPFVVAAAELRDLAAGNTQVVPNMLAAIAGVSVYRDRNVLESLLRRALALVIDRDLLTNAERYGKPQLGSHLERYLVDALRRLAASHAAWRPNADKSRVWFGMDGLFLLWPNAADDLRKRLEADELPGIPKAPETLLDILLAAGLFEPQAPGNAIWRIYPPGAREALDAVKLAAPAALFTESENIPTALSRVLTSPSPAPAKMPKSDNLASPALWPDASRRTATSEPRHTSRETPEQLPLPISAETIPEPPAGSLPPSEQPTPKPELVAPLRLPLVVKRGLQAIISTLGTDEEAARMMEDGLFVPLLSFRTHKIEAPVALRALADTGMLAAEGSVQRTFRNEDVPGVLVALRHVRGISQEQEH
ncbi:MAG: TraI domain-containing protein [Azoarcus sp.]|nr:TraI domain-containing protein [Azoarcus sp.]